MDSARDIAPALRRLDRLIWTLIVAVAAIVLAAPFVSRFYLEWQSFTPAAAAALMLLSTAWFYRRVRPDARLASGLESTAQVTAFAAVGAPLSYLAASANLPLQDHIFAAVDQGLGLDWRAVLAWMNAFPVSHMILSPIYLSLTLQMTTAVLCLAFTGRLLRLRVYTLGFILAALVTIAISGLLPAEGAWPYYGMTAVDSPHFTPAVSTTWLPVFEGLRDGSFRALMGVGAEGIIPFPSLHAALAVILILALWPVRILGWIALLLNLTMVAATPIEGSHYFIDVMAGSIVAALCFAVASRISARIGQPVATSTGMIPAMFRQRVHGQGKLDSIAALDDLALLIDRAIGHIIPLRFVMFAGVGGMGLIVHMFVLATLNRGIGISFAVADSCAAIVAMTFNFFINNLLTYRDMRLRGFWPILRGLLSFSAVCAIGGAANVGIAIVLFQRNHTWWVAAAAGIFVSALWNYTATSIFTWRNVAKAQKPILDDQGMNADFSPVIAAAPVRAELTTP